MTGHASAGTPADICSNCATALAGNFCHACGQRGETPKLTLPHLLHEFPHAVFHVDRGFFATLSALAIRPGRTIREYLDGKRARYFNPLTLLVITCGLSAVGYARYPFDYAPLEAGVPPQYRVAFSKAMQLMFEYYTPLMTLMLPLLSAITSMLFRGRGRSYGEHLVANAYIFSFLNLISLALLPLCIAGNGSAWFIAIWLFATIPIFGYQAWATYDAFSMRERQLGDALRALVGVAVFYCMFSLVQSAIIGFYIVQTLAPRQ